MFQAEQKEAFIQEYSRSRVVALTSLYALFKKTNIYEETLNKDCSQFTVQEILQMYKEFKAKSINVLLNYNVILKFYARFVDYINGGEGKGGAYESITKHDIAPCITEEVSKILSREEIMDIEDQLYNWMDKAIIECLWEGISGNHMMDLVGIESHMINKNTKILTINNKEYQLTDRLYIFLQKAFSETSYFCYGPALRFTELKGDGCLYKTRPQAYAAKATPDTYFRWVYRKIQTFREYIGNPRITMKDISQSGFVYYLQKGIDESGLGIREFLKSDEGEKLAHKYGYNSEAYYIENCQRRFEQYIK